jgi:hypothetical protein
MKPERTKKNATPWSNMKGAPRCSGSPNDPREWCTTISAAAKKRSDVSASSFLGDGRSEESPVLRNHYLWRANPCKPTSLSRSSEGTRATRTCRRVLSPVDCRPIDFNHRLANQVSVAEILNRRLAGRDRPICGDGRTALCLAPGPTYTSEPWNIERWVVPISK